MVSNDNAVEPIISIVGGVMGFIGGYEFGKSMSSLTIAQRFGVVTLSGMGGAIFGSFIASKRIYTNILAINCMGLFVLTSIGYPLYHNYTSYKAKKNDLMGSF